MVRISAIVFLWLWAVVMAVPLWCAVTIGGTVVDDEDGEAISNVLCSVRRGKGAPVSYTFTDNSGKFMLTAEPTDSVSFSLIGYAKRTVSASSLGEDAVIRLGKADFALKEIVVKAPPIRQRGDTLVYDVNSFKSQNDKYISDVLKKLPGVTVSDNGAIQYQGRGINKFYIEGRDLLEGKYTLASNGLDVNAVKSVEIIEHNQHVKSLQDIQPSDRAAVNLKLDKRFLVRPFGEVRAGAGNGPVYDAGLLATLLTRGAQALVTLQANNTGKDFMSESADKLSFSDIDTYIGSYSPVLSVPDMRSINLPLNRYLFNRSRLGSINILVPIGKESEFKLNAIYTADRMRQHFGSDSRMNLGSGESLYLFERGSIHNAIDNLKLSGIYELNAARHYLRDEFGFLSEKERGVSRMFTQSDSVDYTVENSPREFYNKLNTHLRFGRSQLVSFASNLKVGLAPEHMSVLYPSLPDIDIEEGMRMERLVTKNKLESSFPFLGHRLGLGAFVGYERRQPRYSVHMAGVRLPDGLIADGETAYGSSSLLNYGVEPKLEFRWGGERIYLKLTPAVSGYASSASAGDISEHSVKFLPAVALTYRLTSRWETRLGARRTFSYLNGQSLFPAPFMSDYRTVYVPSGELQHTDSYTAYYTLSYRNSVSLLFAVLNLSYAYRKSNFMPVSYYTSDMSVISTRLKDNSGNSFDISAELTKTFTGSKTTVKFQPSFSRMGQDVAQQDIMSRNIYSIYSANLHISNRWFSQLYVQYRFSGYYMHNRSGGFGSSSLTNWFHTLDVSYFPVKKFSIDMKAELSTLDNASAGHDNFFFCDLSGTYTFRKLTLMLSARNLFDVKDYTVTNFSSVNESTRSLPLRGREVIATVKFKF